MRAPHFAVIVGSLKDGFSIARIEQGQDAEEESVVKHLADGRLAEWVEVRAPSSVKEAYTDDETGENFLMLDSGFGEGLTLFGPFHQSEDAEQFGENECADQDWSLWTWTVPDAPAATERPRS